MKLPRTPTMKPTALILTITSVAALALTACSGGGPGNEQDLSDALSRDEVFSVSEADCIAGKVFAEYGADEDAIGKISGADDVSEVESGENAVDGFTERFQSFQRDCEGDA